MNFAQRIVPILAFLAILGMTPFPPWVYIYNPPARFQAAVKTERPAGYHLFFGGDLPKSQTELVNIFNLNIDSATEWSVGLQFFSSRIDATRLTIQILVTLLLTAILYLVLRSGTKTSAQ